MTANRPDAYWPLVMADSYWSLVMENSYWPLVMEDAMFKKNIKAH